MEVSAGEQDSRKKKQSRDLNGFGDPKFFLCFVNEKMCPLNVCGLNLDWWPYFVQGIQLFQGAV